MRVSSFPAPPPPSASAAGGETAIRPEQTIRLFDGTSLAPFYTWLVDSHREDPLRVFTRGRPGGRRPGDPGQRRALGRPRHPGVVPRLPPGRGVPLGPRHLGQPEERRPRQRDPGPRPGPRRQHRRRTGTAPGCARSRRRSSRAGWATSSSSPASTPRGGSSYPAPDRAGRHGPRRRARLRSEGEPREFEGGRINWFGRDPEWADRLGFRGGQDVESPLGEWTRLEVIADGDRVTNVVNGTVVNEGTRSSLTEGQILVQSEGAEIYFRRIDLEPLRRTASSPSSGPRPPSTSSARPR